MAAGVHLVCLEASLGQAPLRLANGEALDDILVDAFATVREAAKRTLGLGREVWDDL